MAAEPTRKDATAIVDRAAAQVGKGGSAALIAEVNAAKPDWSSKDLYLVIYDANAVVMAHPFNPKLVGKNLLEVPDIDGKHFRKEIVAGAKAQGQGWSEYKIQNPENKKVEHKVTYYKRAGDVIILAGIFADAN
jgi:signal transduction histidine kinase